MEATVATDLGFIEGIKRHFIVSIIALIFCCAGLIGTYLWSSAENPGGVATAVRTFGHPNIVYHSVFNDKAIIVKLPLLEFERQVAGRPVTASVWQGWISQSVSVWKQQEKIGEYRDTIWYLVERDGVVMGASEPVQMPNTVFTYTYAARFDPRSETFFVRITGSDYDGLAISLIGLVLGLVIFIATYVGRKNDWSLL